MRERLDQRLIGVLHSGVFAYDRNGDVAFGIADALIYEAPARKVRRRHRIEPKSLENFAIKTGLVIGLGYRVDVIDGARLDHRAFAHVEEKRELPPLACRYRAVGATQKNVGLDADRAQLLDRMLRRLGLQLTSAGDEGQQREMDIDRVMARQVVAKLSAPLEQTQAL